jgi:hypothetical protein
MWSRYKKIIELFFSFLLAGLIINFFFSENTNFETLAMGEVTTPVFASVDSLPIQTLGTRQLDKALEGYQRRKDTAIVLMLGNSQSHSINQVKEHQKTFPALLFDSLHPKSISVISSSIPNANLEEFYLLYKIWSQRIKIKSLVIPVFLDDTREDGIQSVFFPNVAGFKIDESNKIAEKINLQIQQANKSEKGDLAALEQTFQEKTETKLNSILETEFALWQRRPTIRGDLFNNLYKLRNTIFGIDAKSKRRIIKEFYDDNMLALKFILEDCKKNHVDVLVYVPPIRNDYEIPYIRKEYADFKTELQQMCSQYQVNFLNIENCVPGKYWGLKGTRTFSGRLDIDFMHFQYAGHVIVAKALQPHIEKLIR